MGLAAGCVKCFWLRRLFSCGDNPLGSIKCHALFIGQLRRAAIKNILSNAIFHSVQLSVIKPPVVLIDDFSCLFPPSELSLVLTLRVHIVQMPFIPDVAELLEHFGCPAIRRFACPDFLNALSGRAFAIPVSHRADYPADTQPPIFKFNSGKSVCRSFIGLAYARIHNLFHTSRPFLASAIAKALNEKGVRSRTGKPWNPTTIRTMLTNPFYAGIYRYNYRDESGKSHVVKAAKEWVMVEDHHPAIVTRERQNRIATLLQSRQRGLYSNGLTYQRKNTHIFAGLLRCGCCGSSMASTIDRERSDGWRPSIYMCTRRRRFNDCQNKYVSDITLGPFILNFIANMIRVSNSFGKSTSIETLEKKLLRGDVFSNVDHIERPGLEELYAHLRSGFDEMSFESTGVQAAESASQIQERDLLLAEKRRLERALNRLRSLYLYSEDEMPEKDYIVERKQLTDRLGEVDARLEEVEKLAVDSLTLSDEEFMAKASYFILTQQLQDKRYVNYERFIRKIDPQIVKDFLNSIVTNFCIKDGLTTSILFKNGLEIQFSYKSTE